MANGNLFAKFRELWSGNPVIPCGSMHWCAPVKWFFDNFHMFADSFSVLSIHAVARGLGAKAFCTSALHRAVIPCDSTALL